MRSAKRRGEHSDFFNSLCIVYLRQPKDRLARQLATPGTGGALVICPARDTRLRVMSVLMPCIKSWLITQLTDRKRGIHVALEIKELLGMANTRVSGEFRWTSNRDKLLS